MGRDDGVAGCTVILKLNEIGVSDLSGPRRT